MEQKINIFGLLVLIGAILALISVFLNWADISIPLASYSDSASGFDIVREENGTSLMMMPLVVILMAIIAIILGIMELQGKGLPISKIAMLVIGILVIVLSYLAYNAFLDLGKETLGADWAYVTAKMGFGIFMTFASGIILMLASILGLAKVLPE
jgi:hypothetical protein